MRRLLPALACCLLLAACGKPSPADKGPEPGVALSADLPCVIVYGDTRTGHDAHKRLVDRMLRCKPIAVFHAGDLVDNGNSKRQWDEFGKIIAPLVARAPFWPAAGNHDKEAAQFYRRYKRPGNLPWYAVDAGKLRVTVLDSCLSLRRGSKQYRWLAAELTNALVDPYPEYRIVVLHHPLYSTGPHEEDERGQRDVLLPLLAAGKIDAVFAGHVHAYERSAGPGFVHVTTGGGGAPLHDQDRKSPESRVYHKRHQFCRLVPLDNRLRVESIADDGTLLDAFDITNRRATGVAAKR